MTLSEDLDYAGIPFTEELDQHERNQQEVRRLLEFDNVILDFCIGAMEHLEKRLKDNDQIQLTPIHHFPSNTIQALRGIRQNASMRSQYEHMYNQCLVLSVSYFSSGFEALFVQGVKQACCCCPDLLVASKEDLKFTISELRACDFQLGDNLGKMIVLKKDINFQNMQAGLKAFKDFLGVEGFSEHHVHNVIAALAARHSIIHNLAYVDERFMALVKHAPNRTLLTSVGIGSQLTFTPSEILTLQESMAALLLEVANAMTKRIVDSNIEEDAELKTA